MKYACHIACIIGGGATGYMMSDILPFPFGLLATIPIAFLIGWAAGRQWLYRP